MTKALIINFNRITLPMKMAAWIVNHGLQPVIIDNASTNPALLEFYKYRCPYDVLRMDQNYGHLVVWKQNVLASLGIADRYIVTDPDLDLSGIPADFMHVLEEGLRRYPTIDKCGFSLEIEDLTNQGTIEWEKKFWQYPLDNQYYNAQIDTTFALYRSSNFSFNAARTARPYTAKHIPWYYNHISELPADEQYYYNTQLEEYANHTNVIKANENKENNNQL